jgi:hypothetical protein
MTRSEKICRALHGRNKWTTAVCDAFCDVDKRLKCNFLAERIIEAANKGDESALRLPSPK